MGLLRRIGTILGFLKDDPHAGDDDDDDHHHHQTTPDSLPRRPRKGFSVQVAVAAAASGGGGDKPNAAPIVVPCSVGEGGVQGFRWYGRRLRIDEDGDVADEFLDEVSPPDSSGAQDQRALHRFVVKYSTRPAPVRKQIIALNGNIHPSMEYQGMLRWV
ncbi:uncharacterized protein M6B38_268950 [Iris pallida]|uniref:Uncharacterized protein n=1 Tax=Iris pallida TaxID=29817 RepID=A0AAX6I9E5_IRIPA|nr:uncharacterized protein M6B38_118695 [Iris pallida]KAJ6849940.1 uncharacterized protein M6B38_268950 [Iris pallida]